MDAKIFEPFFKHLVLNLKPNFNQQDIERITSDLWQRPFDVVIKKYNIPLSTVTESIDLLENLDLHLKISTFHDYTFIKNLKTQKLLVTTGITALQIAKIKALKIENDFDKIVINDTLKESKTKQDIFNDLKQEFNLNPETTFVIGDHPESEIEAGNALNFITIQILRNNVIKGGNAKHYINSFAELDLLIN
jgi:FMN phosphatase YigB (HAD superfamily)